MTAYTDLVYDFPARCREVLDLAYGPAESRGREVTLLLMTAAAAFLVPFERLRRGEHPAGDRQLFPELAQRLDAALDRPFLSSPFSDGAASWSAGKLQSIASEPDVWPELQPPKPVDRQTPTMQLLAGIRNALAHGNLYTKSGYLGPAPTIESLVFVSEDRDKEGGLRGYRYVHVSPADFRLFLDRWFAFLEEQQLRPQLVAETLARSDRT